MTIQTSRPADRHLAAVPNLAVEAADRALATCKEIQRDLFRYAVGAPADEIPAAVVERLEELDALAATASDVLDMATDRMNAARAALCEAARALAEAEEAWSKAGTEAEDAAHAAADAREAAGVKWSASGYVLAATQ